MGFRERAEQRKKRIVAHVAHSHEEAEQWDLEFWQSQTPQERLSALVAIHEDMEKLNPRRHREDVQGVRAVKRLRKRRST